MDISKSKDILFKVLSCFVGVLAIIVVYVVFFGPLGNYINSLTVTRTMSVSASDKVVAVPDVATFSFSVVSEGVDVSSISNENNSKINNAIAMLKQNGIADNDIETSGYDLVPVYTQSGVYSINFVPTIAKYRLTQTISVKMRDFSKISPVLNSLSSLKVSNISGISFSVDSPDKYLSDARAKAFQKAKDKAQTMAQQSGVGLGKIVSVSDYSSGYSPMYKSASIMSAAAPAIENVAPVIQPGSQDITANVNIIYEIK